MKRPPRPDVAGRSAQEGRRLAAVDRPCADPTSAPPCGFVPAAEEPRHRPRGFDRVRKLFQFSRVRVQRLSLDQRSDGVPLRQQYRSLAGQVLLWQGAHGIPLTRLTTHAAVDRSHSRYDPRSFRWDRFDLFYKEAAERCGWQRFNNQQAGL